VTDGYAAVETLYHALLTGLILATTLHRGRAVAAELVFRLFRRQHLEKFLPGLKKLGLSTLPHAIACAQYHTLSNALGGVKVEYLPESERKAWVRYVPPRWIYSGTAICGVPTEVSRAMLRAWHAHNGVSLGNPRLGFVCTKQTTDGQPGLEGYYYEYDRDLAEHERLRFARDEEGPAFDPAHAPKAEGPEWPAERLRKVQRNYAMDYVRNILPELVGLLGDGPGGELGRFCAKQIGMQYYDEVAGLLFGLPARPAARGFVWEPPVQPAAPGPAGIMREDTRAGDTGRIAQGEWPGSHGRGTAEEFAEYLVRFGRAQDDDIAWERDGNGIVVRQRTWRLMAGLEPVAPGVFTAWNGLWEGALAVHGRGLRLQAMRRENLAEWVVG
jgi:hypothetical protein